jgi:hypothetical protein
METINFLVNISGWEQVVGFTGAELGRAHHSLIVRRRAFGVCDGQHGRDKNRGTEGRGTRDKGQRDKGLAGPGSAAASPAAEMLFRSHGQAVESRI